MHYACQLLLTLQGFSCASTSAMASSSTVVPVLSQQLELRFDQARGNEGRLIADPFHVRFKRIDKSTSVT